MVDTYTANLRLTKPEVGANEDAWQSLLNDGMIELAEDSIADVAGLDVTGGNVTLTTVNGATDTARMMFLRAFGTPGVSRDVTVPTLAKIYMAQNDSDDDVVFKTAAGTGVTIVSGSRALLYVNESDDEVYAVSAGNPVTAAPTTITATATIVGATGGNLTTDYTYTAQGDWVFLVIEDFSSTGFATETLLELDPGASWPTAILQGTQPGYVCHTYQAGAYFPSLLIPPISIDATANIRFTPNNSPFSWTLGTARAMTHTLTMVYPSGGF